ncbi:MAG: hypothetical protein AB1813_15670, partial [Verrucomicrobiota bacterium]
GVRFSRGIEFQFTGSLVTNLPPGATVLIVKNSEAFRERYGDAYTIAGEFAGNLDNNGEILRLDDSAGEKILEFDYEADWFAGTDGGGWSLEVVDPRGDWWTWDLRPQWRQGTIPGGSPDASDLVLLSWRNDHFNPDELENSLVSGPLADPDLDSQSNHEEFVSATDPKDATSFLHFQAPEVDPSKGLILRFHAREGKAYSLLKTSSIQNNVAWEKVRDIPAEAIDRPECKVEIPFSQNPAGFYRLAVQP